MSHVLLKKSIICLQLNAGKTAAQNANYLEKELKAYEKLLAAEIQVEKSKIATPCYKIWDNWLLGFFSHLNKHKT